MDKKISVTVGIPAYNEEANIGHLLEDVLKQRGKNFILREVIVSSDGSDDDTVKIVKGMEDKRIVLLDNKNRKGVATRQNQIMSGANGQALLLLNADVLLGKRFIERMVGGLIARGADLISSALEPMPPRNMFEKMLCGSVCLKNRIFEGVSGGENVYTCHGAARMMSSRLYKKLKFKDSVGEDAYSYLFTKRRGYAYAYVKEAVCYYRVPDNFLDHKKQSLRFGESKQKFVRCFGEDFVRREYKISLLVMLRSIVGSFVERPVTTVSYLLIVAAVKIRSVFGEEVKDIWEISKSSKILR
jgi:glycosyltransferase involved in cell wall biosynthesis